MYIMYDNAFELFCQQRYQNYCLACDIMGITEIGTYHDWRNSNIEWLEDLYLRSEDRLLH
jgi:hypothetical protein